MVEQSLRQTIQQEGAEESAKAIGVFEQSAKDLREELERLGKLQADPGATTEQLKTQASAVNQAKKAYQELGGEVGQTNVDMDALSAVLGRVNPAFGNLISGARDAARSLGSLGNVPVNQFLSKGVSLAREYAGTLKLLGAGTAAYLAVTQIARQWEKVKEQELAAIEAARQFEQANRKIGENRENVRDEVVRSFAESNPRATDEQVQAAVDKAFREVQNLGADVSGAVARATGRAAPLSEDQEAFLSRTQGLGARRKEAARELQSFKPEDTLTSGTQFIDTGTQAAVLKFIEQFFNETGEAAQKRIESAQRVLFEQGGGKAKLPLADNIVAGLSGNRAGAFQQRIKDRENFGGQELLQALKLTTEQMKIVAGNMAESSKAQSDLDRSRSDKIPSVPASERRSVSGVS